ncbi:hypothetical protein Enr13x_37380 [Stieleria neptunia]|uniref:Uncharacterized protein n=2 Tax=Stieleria neptunia TaxID=2527979 RepID=A0A518HST0_9BACT|nr:hypothetical protein Enr13x_37380 [Stieleria neptunia]
MPIRLASTLSISPREMADQERRSGEYENTTQLLYQSMVKYGLMLKDAGNFASNDRSTAKQKLSNAFGSWVASLEFFLRVKQWTRRIPEDFLGIYDRAWEVFRPRSHWYALGAAREPWLIAAYDGRHHGHIFRIPHHHWWPDESNLRILTDPQEATPNFVVGYNRVYDELIGLPQVKAQVKLRRLSPIGG